MCKVYGRYLQTRGMARGVTGHTYFRFVQFYSLLKQNKSTEISLEMVNNYHNIICMAAVKNNVRAFYSDLCPGRHNILLDTRLTFAPAGPFFWHTKKKKCGSGIFLTTHTFSTITYQFEWRFSNTQASLSSKLL